MKKYFVLPFFAFALLLGPPETSQANIIPNETKIIQGHPARLSSIDRITLSAERGKVKIKMKTVAGRTAKNGAVEVSSRSHKRRNAQKDHVPSQAPPTFANIHGLDQLRQYYQNWRGTRYQAGGISHAGVDCSGFTTLTFRDLYGVKLPRTAHEQAMQGIAVDRNSLLPGDLVFFKRARGGNHVGIYLGDGNFMHASTSQGVTISSINDVYWRHKFWKGSRLQLF